MIACHTKLLTIEYVLVCFDTNPDIELHINLNYHMVRVFGRNAV